MTGAVERRSDQLGHPGVEHDLALHVGAWTVADVEDASDEPAGTGDEEASRFDGQPPRLPIDWDRLEERRELPREAFGPGTRPAERANRKAAAEVEGVEMVEPAPHQAEQRQPATHGVAPRVDGTKLGSDVEVDPARNKRAEGLCCHAFHHGRQLGFGHAELRARRANGQPCGRLRDDRRVEAEQHVERGAVAVPSRARRAMAISASASSGDSIASQAGGPPAAASRTARRRSASVLPMPSIVMRSCGTPARRAIAHSPPETTFAPRPNPCRTVTTPATSFALTENWRMIGSGNATASSAAAERRTATSVTNSGVPNRRAASRSPSAMSVRRSVSGVVPFRSAVVTARQSLTTECATEFTTPSTTAPTIAATIVSAVKSGG